MSGRRVSGALAFAAAVALFSIAEGAYGAPVATFSNSQPVEISAFGSAVPYGTSISVSGLAGTTTSTSATVNGMSHANPDDVGIVLVAPNGAALLLEDGAGDAEDLVDVTTTFADSAGGQLPTATAWASGTYKPTTYYTGDNFPPPGPGTTYGNPGPALGGTATLASTFNGINPNGFWTLYVRDFTNGNSGSIARGWSIQVQTTLPDTQAPDTVIESGPSGPTAAVSASFSFSASELSTFECSLDSAAFAACTSPQTYNALADGEHTVSVRATDPTANTDPTPATRTFTVDTVAPETTIDSGPSGTTGGSAADVSFSANESVSFACKLDSQPFAPCVSPQSYSGLTEGQHTFQLRATDAAGNVDRTGAVRTFTLATPPTVTITKPKPKRGKRKVRVEFAGLDDSTSIEALEFTCSLDGGAASPCTSPATFKRLAIGRHTVSVVARDLAGNESAPGTTSFRIRSK